MHNRDVLRRISKELVEEKKAAVAASGLAQKALVERDLLTVLGEQAAFPLRRLQALIPS